MRWREISLICDSTYCLIGSSSLQFTGIVLRAVDLEKERSAKMAVYRHNCNCANTIELCTWVTFLIVLHLQKCFVINVMKKSAYIYRGNLYLSVISCQWCSSYVSNITTVTLERQCYRRIFNSVLSAVNDVIHSQGPGSRYRMRPDKWPDLCLAGGRGGLQLATQVICPMFTCVFTRFSGHIEHSVWFRYYCCVERVVGTELRLSNLQEESRARTRLRRLSEESWFGNMTGVRLGSSSTQRRQNVRKHWC